MNKTRVLSFALLFASIFSILIGTSTNAMFGTIIGAGVSRGSGVMVMVCGFLLLLHSLFIGTKRRGRRMFVARRLGAEL